MFNQKPQTGSDNPWYIDSLKRNEKHTTNQKRDMQHKDLSNNLNCMNQHKNRCNSYWTHTRHMPISRCQDKRWDIIFNEWNSY